MRTAPVVVPLFLLAASLPRAASALVIALDPETMAPPASEASGTPAPATSVPEAAPRPGPVTVTASPSKTEVAPGERFVVEVTAKAPTGTTFVFPAEIVTDAAELRPVPATGGPSDTPVAPLPAGVHRYDAAVFELSDATIPALTVEYRLPDGTAGKAATEPVALKVVSRLPKDADPQKIADVRGPLSLSVGRAFWVTLGILGAGLAALVFWLVRRRRRPALAPATPTAPPLDPAAEARAALAALVAADFLARGDHRGFYIVLTAIAKRYLERRLGAPVLEMTTAEMVAFLRDSPPTSALVGPMRDLAGAADQIKFARGAGLTAEAERHTEAVRGMIATTEAAFAPPPAAAAEKVA
jgi:hypothetical protein